MNPPRAFPPPGEHRPTIPPQRLPGFVRWPVRVMLWPFLVLDSAAQALVRGLLHPHRVVGKCTQRGECCRAILVTVPDLCTRVPLLERAFLWWLTEIHGFYPRGFSVETAARQPALVLGCRYLRDDGRCAHHALRPEVCRTYPRASLDGDHRILPGCGYRIVPRSAARATLRVLPDDAEETPREPH